MQSHEYSATRHDMLRLLGSVLGGMAAWVLLLHLLGLAGMLPSPRPATDVDSTILIHQADAAQHSKGHDLVLLGDSSCLMNVDAAGLARQLNMSCLNLGTLSFLDLDAAADLMRLQSSPPQNAPRQVILLMHPEALRRAMAEVGMQRFMSDYIAGRHRPITSTWLGRIQAWTGLTSWKARVVDRFLSAPLPGAFGRHYGFCRQLEAYMTAHGGSALDPRTEAFTGNAEYRLAPGWQEKSRAFAAGLPPGTELMVGITPLPETFAPESFASTRNEMLHTWATWLGTPHVLEGLPETMPDRLFATVTHLNQEGVGHYTRLLGELIGGGVAGPSR